MNCAYNSIIDNAVRGNKVTNQLKDALFNARRYSILAMAKEVSTRQTYRTSVLLGDDGLYWVPSTNREAGLLIKAGYERAL